VARGRRSRGGHGGHEEEHADERWLLTYADMITLLMALFIVMWSISNVNTSKFDELARSLDDAFSGAIITGGTAIMENGAGSQAERPAPEAPIQALRPSAEPPEVQLARIAPAREEADLQALKARIDEVAAREGLRAEVETTVAERGLVVRVLTDRVLFDSGSAAIKPAGAALVGELSALFKAEVRHPIQVEGNTDSVPVRGAGGFPTNWELSGARAAAVVRGLIAEGVAPGRLSIKGNADRRPVASNATAAGRHRNRRVELVLLRTQGGTRP
jgi:chemotaxis protein MotB